MLVLLWLGQLIRLGNRLLYALMVVQQTAAGRRPIVMHRCRVVVMLVIIRLLLRLRLKMIAAGRVRHDADRCVAGVLVSHRIGFAVSLG